MDVRASDADRERVAALLRDHYGAGRLTDDELSERLDGVYGARRTGELERYTADLPAAPAPGRGTPKRVVTPAGRALRTSVLCHATIYALVHGLLIAIWALSGGGEFWPVWSLLGWGVGLGAHAAPLIAGAGTRPYGEPQRELPPAVQRAAAPDGTVTLLFTDIEGSTALNERLGDLRYVELVRRHHALIRKQIQGCGGYEVKVQGDGFMVAFPSARSAVGCARAIQAEIAALPDVRVRIGLHTGEAIREDSDFYGRNVALAARIARCARGGETLASEIVKRLTESAGDIDFTDERELELDGIAGVQRVYAVA
jgi:class 3 adenylate cyclase